MRAVVAAAKAVGLAIVFTLGAALGVIVHLGLAAPRRFVTARVNAILAASFEGRVTIRRVGVLGITGIDGVDAEVLDPEGRLVLVLRGVGARFETLALVRSLVGRGPLVVRVPELNVHGADAVVEPDAAGGIGLLRAFDARGPRAGGRGIDVSIPAVRLGHAWVHGHLPAAPVIDVDLEDLACAFAKTQAATTIDVGHLFVRGRGVPGLNPEGNVEARAALPSGAAGERRLAARYDGRVGEIPLHADGSLTGKAIAVTVDVPETAASAFAALARGHVHLGAGAILSAHAEVHGELPVLKPELRARIGGGEIAASGTVTLPEAPRTEVDASATVSAKDLDVSLLQEGAPASRLTARLEASAVLGPGGKVAGTFFLASEIGEVGGHVVPAASLGGDFTESSARGSARIAEPGAPTSVQLSLGRQGGRASLDQLAFTVDTTVDDLSAFPRAGTLGRGRARLLAEGRVDLHTKSFSARASVDVVDLDVKGVHLARGRVTGSAGGALGSPRVVAKLVGVGVRAGGYAFNALRASASGTPRAFDAALDLEGDERAPSVHVSTSIAGRSVRGEVVANLGKAGRLDLSAASLTLGGAATDPRAWTAATGTITLDGVVDLGWLLAQVPVGSRPVEAAAGLFTVRGKARRASTAASPSLEVDGSTKGLAVVRKGLRAQGVDGTFAVRLSSSTGRTQVSAELHDDHGLLASLDASASLPVAEILASPTRLPALAGDAPIEAKLSLPRRSLGALPPMLGALPVEGDVELTADLQGTPRAPTKLTLTARGTNLLARGGGVCVRPVDLEATVAYDGEAAVARLSGSRDGRGILAADATVKVSAARAFAGAWEASADVALTRFPLDVVGSLLHRSIAGDVSGRVAVSGLHRDARAAADIDLRGLALDRVTFPRGKVRVTLEDGALSASARLDQVDGYAETTAAGSLTWGAALAPRLDPAKPVDVAIQARNLRADAAMPFVQGIFSELDGRVDADARIRVERGGEDGHVEGAVVVRDGTFELPALGERFHALRGRIVMSPWGTLRFEDFAADPTTGHLTASGQVVLEGLTRLRSAGADVHVARGQSIPVSLEGVPLGRAYGDVKAAAKMSPDGRRLDVDVDVPTLHVDLPRSIGHGVQSLAPDGSVRVGLYADGSFVPILLAAHRQPRPPSDLVIHAAVKLGDDVQVRRDTTLDVVVHGRIDVLVSDQAHVSGRIDLERGRLELQGKQFMLDRGAVSFVGGDPDNPMIVASAYWDAPEGTRVFADFSGFVTSGKLSLRSEPALSQDEILSLLLFGSSEGSFGVESAGLAAASLVGGIVTQGLNKAISGITSADITTRVDTSQANSPRPELAVQITRRISASLGYKLGVPGPGENPDRIELTLAFRLVRNWSLVAVVGDQGSTALDVTWRRRY